jgi:hypothetical protein
VVADVTSDTFTSFLRARYGVTRGVTCAIGAALMVTTAGCGGGGSDIITVDVPNSIAVADVNGDGVPDLLVATTADQGNADNPGFAAVILGNKSSPGTFQRAAVYNTQARDPSSIAVADLTGAGASDLVVANFGSGSASVFMHDPANAGHYQTAVSVTTGGQPKQVVIGDVNGDGKPDLVLADLSTSGNAILVLQDGNNPGHFLPPVNLSTGNLTAGVAVGDLNGDGKPDIVAANFDGNGNNGRVSVFFQDPANPGNFLARVDFPAGAQPQAVRIADLNGDGLPDLVVANRGPGSDGTGTSGVSVLLQDAAHPGTFLAPVTYATQPGSVDVVVGDLNGDGLPDLVVANLGPLPSGSVSVLLQNAATRGTFQTATSYPGFGQPLSVAIADLNGDGHPDIAVADATTATVMLQNATSPGTFANPVQVGF